MLDPPTHTHIHTYIYIHAHTHIYTHTNTHTYTHQRRAASCSVMSASTAGDTHMHVHTASGDLMAPPSSRVCVFAEVPGSRVLGGVTKHVTTAPKPPNGTPTRRLSLCCCGGWRGECTTAVSYRGWLEEADSDQHGAPTGRREAPITAADQPATTRKPTDQQSMARCLPLLDNLR